MRLRKMVLGAAASAVVLGLAGAALAQAPKMNLPGCGPAEGETYQIELTARQNALEAARGTLQAARAALAAALDKYRAAGCAPGMAGVCAEVSAELTAVRASIQANGAFVTDLAAAVNAYRGQQPFVTPTGEACLRCKSPGDFACANPGTVAGFTPLKMPTLASAGHGGGASSSGAGMSGAGSSGAHHGSGPLHGNVTANLAPGAHPQSPPAAPAQQPAAFNLSGIWTDGQTSHMVTHTGNTITLGQPGNINGRGTINGQEISLGHHVGFPIFDSNGTLTHIGWRGGTAQAWRRCPDPAACPPLPAAFNLSGLWTDGHHRITVTHSGSALATVQQPGNVQGQGTVNGQEIVLGRFIGGPIFDGNGNLTHIGWRGGAAQAWRRCVDHQPCP